MRTLAPDSRAETPFSATLRERRGSIVLRVSGPVDLTTFGRFQKTLAEALECARNGGPPRVVVDLTGCEAMNSRGLWAVLESARRLRDSGGELRVADAVEGPVRDLFEATSEDHGLRVYPDASAALSGPVPARGSRSS